MSSDDEVQVQSSEEETTAAEAPKRGRGRPKKNENSSPSEAVSPQSGREGGSPERIPVEENFLAAQPSEPCSSLQFDFKTPLPPSTVLESTTEPVVSAPAAVFTAPEEAIVSETPELQPEQEPAPEPLLGGCISDQQQPIIEDSEFQPAQNFQFGESDFDFLLSKGCGKGHQVEETPRDSLLLKFDPLLRVPVCRLSVTEEQEEHENNSSSVGVVEIPHIVETAPAAEEAEGDSGGEALLTALEASGFVAVSPSSSSMNIDEEKKSQPHCADEETTVEAMSVDNTMVLDSESSTDRNMSCSDPEFNSSNELVDTKRSKNESLKIEELEKKLADAEIREETLLKRITEKDKTISKMSGVVEAYERAIAELIAEKEQTTQNYEKMCEALKADSDINAQHLESLEKTFSDLHAKYERMKVVTQEYKEREEELVSERNRFEESLRMQEKRYENMKSHAMTQLEIANTKLSELLRNHAQEITKLKALLKKEEIYRASVNEQLNQKSRENDELVKICEELINGGAN
ncbi:transforming acidic coiled-coil-containing protein 2 isoform X2 [Toxorhynchites rutilus septentrionalis]|uniref:transforming acidic coiled-coil-containing protein 2 isoform X2 n=1 Tax=Toxorhynchites rutilus septentrionalis TaxID=329112 RepID=UPI002479D256|nr:transforming acidic coiled-coil-containing protein 2 isoform X2 [Toxorhynchites rutilus septentrionalis]